MSILTICFLASSVFFSSSSAYRRKAHHQVGSVTGKSNASASGDQRFTPFGKIACTEAFTPEVEKALFGEGHHCPAKGSVRCGCNLGCKCPGGQSCYVDGWVYAYDDNTKRLGSCNFAVWLTVLFIMLVMILCFCCLHCTYHLLNGS
eukprot:TRINITY_DN42182_c0_g1_i1.p1 TRINITY_DN42182_c0_g1~~TRINITY_DN42182_c0_g1_i1.p1  ORF type:complete len:162 (+),score=4.31 TRINITY_DN42182_c0_g1_i1:47-487(+)